MDKKFETYTYSELVVEFKSITEKTEAEVKVIRDKSEVVKSDLIHEMSKRKELEGIEKTKIAKIIIADLKDVVSPTYIRNILSKIGQTDAIKSPGKTKKEILAIAGGGGQELVPPTQEDLPPREPRVITNDDEDITSNLIPTDDIIDQRPEAEKIEESNDAEEDIDKIHLIRDLKIENNNLQQQLTEVDRLQEENSQLRATIGELESENAKLFNRVKELEDENNKLKAENRALRNPPAQQAVAPVSSRFSTKSHQDYHNKKYYNMVKGKK